MMILIPKQIKLFLILTLVAFLGGKRQVLAQNVVPECQPPNAGEYLVLVLAENQTSQDQVRNLVPPQLIFTICRYRGDIVTRIGNFRRLEDAERWGKYWQNVLNLPTVIARISASSDGNVSRNYPPYNPQVLPQGYVVLVNYNNQPEIASQLRRILNQDIGLVSYRSLPYLLASQHSTHEEAKSVLQNLNNRGFWVIIVNSQDVILLTPVVRYF
jgi:hypothetical protein